VTALVVGSAESPEKARDMSGLFAPGVIPARLGGDNQPLCHVADGGVSLC
jgi:hypothetical protein